MIYDGIATRTGWPTACTLVLQVRKFCSSTHSRSSIEKVLPLAPLVGQGSTQK